MPNSSTVTMTVAAGLAWVFVVAAEQRGVDTGPTLERLGLKRSVLSDPEGRIATQALFSLVTHLGAASNDSIFGLRTARLVDASTFGVLGFALRTSSSLGEAIERVVRYARVLNETTRLTLTRTESSATVFDGPEPPLEWPRHYAELSMANFHLLARKWTGVDLLPLEVAFQHDRPDVAGEVERFFGCPVSWGAETNRIVFPLEALNHSFKAPDAALVTFLDRRLDELRRALETSPGELASVRQEIFRSLSSGPVGIDVVAKSLGLSARTLQRRLREQGTRFDEVVDSVRKEIALTAMRRPRVTLQEISFLCGYSDARVFRRAFQRWTGTNPAAFIAQHRPGGKA